MFGRWEVIVIEPGDTPDAAYVTPDMGLIAAVWTWYGWTIRGGGALLQRWRPPTFEDRFPESAGQGDPLPDWWPTK